MSDINIGLIDLGTPLGEGLAVVAILLLSGVLVLIASLFLNRVGSRLAERLPGDLDERLLAVVTGPILLLVFLQGVFIAATVVSALDPFTSRLVSIWTATDIAILAITLARITHVSLAWYGEEVAPNMARGPLDRRLVNPLRRFLTLTIYILAGMLILDQFSISITPLVAGLGIGGIAVALALQPTLSNFFAGTYLLSDNVISPGDFIELESGLRGYVDEIGWRSTRLRTPFNNLVIIPNSRLSDSILTNYHGPSLEMGVLIEAGVSYASDMLHVERIAMEVARDVVRDLPEAQKEFAPWFGYERFGDSNIDLWLWLQANDRVGSYTIKTELMKRLHHRFNQEGIEINYPVRKLVFPDGAPPAPPTPTPPAPPQRPTPP